MQRRAPTQHIAAPPRTLPVVDPLPHIPDGVVQPKLVWLVFVDRCRELPPVLGGVFGREEHVSVVRGEIAVVEHIAVLKKPLFYGALPRVHPVSAFARLVLAKHLVSPRKSLVPLPGSGGKFPFG